MQLLVLVVQNVVPASEIGTATTAATFIRTLGQAFGPAIFAAILTNRLAAYLPGRAGGGSGEPSAATIRSLPPEVQHTVIEAFVRATNVVFLVAATIMLTSLVLSFFLKEMELQEYDNLTVAEPAGTKADPATADAVASPAGAI